MQGANQRLGFFDEIRFDVDGPIVCLVNHFSESTTEYTQWHSPSEKQNQPNVVDCPLHRLITDVSIQLFVSGAGVA